MKNSLLLILSLILMLTNACTNKDAGQSFEDDLLHIKKYKEVVVLKSNDEKCQLVVVPDYQGRVMTSSSNGLKGRSYGWINHELIASGEFDEHISVFGGEDRFWMGPEGGQYSIFFAEGKDFTMENWHTPSSIDKEGFELVASSESKASFKQDIKLVNYSGFEFSIEVEREVSLFSKKEIENKLNLSLNSEVQYVGYQSLNSIKNTGDSIWKKENGLLSIWILGMFNPSDNTNIIVPYKDSLALNTSYFGEIGPDRLVVKDEFILFRADGKYRCKIGLPPKNIIPRIGSFDSKNNVLTIVEYSFGSDSDYVNSLWELQDDPYLGDVVNSYNDGPLEDGSQLGPFYELESSSPARELIPGQALVHTHSTYHFEGDFDSLNEIAKKVLGINLNDVHF